MFTAILNCVMIEEDQPLGVVMEENIVGQSQNKPITLNIYEDEFDLDSFELKPISRGLGFHDEEKRDSVPTQVAKKAVARSRSSVSKAPKLSGNAFLQSSPQAVSDSGLMSGVEAIYGLKKESNSRSKEFKKPIKSNLKVANSVNVVVAFFLDLVIIAASTALLLGSFYILGFQNFSFLGLLAFVSDSVAYVCMFFALSFLSYFSLLEPVGTLGKRSLSLRVCHIKGQSGITIRQSFIRGLVSLMSLPLLGIPLLLDFHGKLSDSRVVQR